MINSEASRPIYVQIAEWIETQILNDSLKQDEKVYSQYKLAEMFTINPATAAKGLNRLSDEKILYTKRGLGKFVTKEAKDIIIDKRTNHKLKGLLEEVALEAGRLHVSDDQLINMLGKIMKESKGEGE